MTREDQDVARHWTVVRRRRVFSGGPVREVAIELVSLPNGRPISDYCQGRMNDVALVFARTDETPLEAARRELLEETGYISSLWTDLGAV